MTRLLDFYPRSPCGERPYGRINDISRLIFLSTLSLRRATSSSWSATATSQHFYPRSPCGERRMVPLSTCTRRKFLSTLSLRRATHGTNSGTNSTIFLSTLSLRRATPVLLFPQIPVFDFYPRSPCGERPVKGICFNAKIPISIHALLAESDVAQGSTAGD